MDNLDDYADAVLSYIIFLWRDLHSNQDNLQEV